MQRGNSDSAGPEVASGVIRVCVLWTTSSIARDSAGACSFVWSSRITQNGQNVCEEVRVLCIGM